MYSLKLLDYLLVQVTCIKHSTGPESKTGLSYVNVVCVYGGRGGGGRLEVFQIFSACFVCVCACVCAGGGGVRFSTSPSVKKNNRPLPINK